MRIEEGMQAFLARAAAVAGASGPPPDAAERRRRMEVVARETAAARPAGVTVEDVFLPAAGREIPLRLYRPATPGSRPLVLYLHGGGWVAGSIETHDPVAAVIAAAVGAVVVSVHYRRAPESRHPAAIDDAYEVLCWAAANAGQLGVEADRIAVAGDSAGGHLAACCALRARDSGGPQLAFQLLIYPMVEPVFDRPSCLDYAQGPVITLDDLRYFWEAALGAAPETAPASVVPSRQPLAGLPPAYVLTAEYDPLRDEGEAYAQALEAAGVPVRLRRAPGLVHGFIRAGGFSAAVRQEQDTMHGILREALHGTPPTG